MLSLTVLSNMQKYNVLLFSNSIGMEHNYGYSVVAEKVAYYLKDFYNVHVLGMQDVHPPYKKDGIVFLGVNLDAFGSDSLKDYILAYDIDILISMNDIWVPNCHYIPQTVMDTGVKWIAHITVNTTPVPERFNMLLPYAHSLVSPSLFVQNELQASGYPSTYIPHGVDLTIFKPSERKEEDDSFIFLSIMRNKGFQKDFPSLFTAYRMLLDRSEYALQKSKLIVLADPEEQEGFNLYNLRRVMSLEKHVQFVNWVPTADRTSIEPTVEGTGYKHNPNINFPRTAMNGIYSIADCLVSSTAGESFNLPALEAMACGVPIILPENTTAPELTEKGKCGMMAKIQYPQLNPLFSYSMHVSPESLSQCMEKMLDKKTRAYYSEEGIKQSIKYSWESVLPLWRKEIERVIDLPTDYDRRISGI